MKRSRAMCFSILLAIVLVARAQEKPTPAAKWKAWETDTESQFTGRYANCDYGFYVLLPEGYLAHGNHSPSPNHGFLISLPDTNTHNVVSIDDKRFIWVNAEYNSLDLRSLNEAVNWRINGTRDGERQFKLLRREDMRLNRLAAKRFRYQYEGASGTVVEEEAMALRAGILYEIGLRTNPANYRQDSDQLVKVMGNFRWWRIHYC